MEDVPIGQYSIAMVTNRVAHCVQLRRRLVETLIDNNNLEPGDGINEQIQDGRHCQDIRETPDAHMVKNYRDALWDTEVISHEIEGECFEDKHLKSELRKTHAEITENLLEVDLESSLDGVTESWWSDVIGWISLVSCLCILVAMFTFT